MTAQERAALSATSPPRPPNPLPDPLPDPLPTRIARPSGRRKAGFDDLRATLGAASPDVLVHAGDADRSAAETNGLALGNLRQKLEACDPHGLLPAVEGALRRYGRLGSPRQKAMPRNLEGAARLVEGLGNAMPPRCYVSTSACCCSCQGASVRCGWIAMRSSRLTGCKGARARVAAFASRPRGT